MLLYHTQTSSANAFQMDARAAELAKGEKLLHTSQEEFRRKQAEAAISMERAERTLLAKQLAAEQLSDELIPKVKDVEARLKAIQIKEASLVQREGRVAVQEEELASTAKVLKTREATLKKAAAAVEHQRKKVEASLKQLAQQRNQFQLNVDRAQSGIATFESREAKVRVGVGCCTPQCCVSAKHCAFTN